MWSWYKFFDQIQRNVKMRKIWARWANPRTPTLIWDKRTVNIVDWDHETESEAAAVASANKFKVSLFRCFWDSFYWLYLKIKKTINGVYWSNLLQSSNDEINGFALVYEIINAWTSTKRTTSGWMKAALKYTCRLSDSLG